MNELFAESVYFGVALTLVAYLIGMWIKKKVKLVIANPIILAVLMIIALLVALKIDYDTYNYGAQYISALLTPATVSLAVPLYRQLLLLKKYPKAILGGTVVGVLFSLTSIWLMSLAFGLSHEQYVTILPKSITTAIGIGVSEKMGGVVTITVIAIIFTGILGNCFAEILARLFKIEEPVAKGLAIGTSSHSLGTAKAIEMGEVEGAISSLAIVVAGIMTVVAAPFFALLL